MHLKTLFWATRRKEREACHHQWHRKLSLWQPKMPSPTTKPSSRQSSIFSRKKNDVVCLTVTLWLRVKASYFDHFWSRQATVLSRFGWRNCPGSENEAKCIATNNFLIWKSRRDWAYGKSWTESEKVAACNFDQHAGNFDHVEGNFDHHHIFKKEHTETCGISTKQYDNSETIGILLSHMHLWPDTN